MPQGRAVQRCSCLHLWEAASSDLTGKQDTDTCIFCSEAPDGCTVCKKLLTFISKKTANKTLTSDSPFSPSPESNESLGHTRKRADWGSTHRRRCGWICEPSRRCNDTEPSRVSPRRCNHVRWEPRVQHPCSEGPGAPACCSEPPDVQGLQESHRAGPCSLTDLGHSEKLDLGMDLEAQQASPHKRTT